VKLLKAKVENFGSYDTLEFDYTNLGLTLVHGATGSGKSTLQDIAFWCLFGQTAKDGNVDDIRMWGTNTTIGRLSVCTPQGNLEVTRIRGKTNENDLYWIEEGSDTPTRGKNALETQELLERRLGVDSELYSAGAYFNEFSPTSSFFTAKAEARKELFEKIADLELPYKITVASSSTRKDLRPKLVDAKARQSKTIGKLDQVKKSIEDTDDRLEKWDINHFNEIELLKKKSENFLKEKSYKIQAIQTKIDAYEAAKAKTLKESENRIEALKLKIQHADSTQCPTCGNCKEPLDEYRHRLEFLQANLKQTEAQENPHTLMLEPVLNWDNQYDEQIEKATVQLNPFVDQLHKLNSEFTELLKAEALLNDLALDLQYRIDCLLQIQDLASDLRGELLKKSISMVEANTNDYLSKYFDAEFKVLFAVDSDNLDVQIFKNGNECNYKQLSKGQRGLLKLCFVVSIMQATSNKVGVSFNTLFFDESLDGLDDTLKIKAFRLFEALSLEHESVIVIDHSVELKELFQNRFSVTIEDDVSRLEHEI